MKRYLFEMHSIVTDNLSGKEIKECEKKWGKLIKVVIDGYMRVNCLYHGNQVPLEELHLYQHSLLYKKNK